MDKSNELFELMTKMYSEMQEMKGEINTRFDSIDNRFDKVESRLDTVESKLDTVENRVTKTNIIIEQNIKPSISALLDGYTQNSEQITRIDKKLDEHDEIIIRRVK